MDTKAGHWTRILKLRYITTILDKRYPKLYGLERVKFESTIYVTEGPIDSLFLSNAIAMCGADVTLDKDIYNDRVFIYDNGFKKQTNRAEI